MTLVMKSDFDVYQDTYSQEVEKAISFVGQDLDFFTERKARYLLRFLTRSGLDPRLLSVLDVGCGGGFTDYFLSGHFRTLSGVDVSEGMTRQARRKNPSVDYQTFDGASLPFPDSHFDVTFAINVMHHVAPENWEHFAGEMARVTRPGGFLLIFEHNPFNPLTRRVVSRCEFDADAHLLSPKTSVRLLRRKGLAVVERRYILFFPFKGRLFWSLDQSLKNFPLGAQYYVAGRKNG